MTLSNVTSSDVSGEPKSLAGMILVCIMACFHLVLSGCASYQIGSSTLFQPGIRTVHVPMVKNQTFRHDLGVRLSEAIVKEIDRRTPYKVTGNPNADSTLNVTLTHETKRILSETNDDDPRAIDAAISASIEWVSREGEFSMTFGQNSWFIPEAGQSMDTATQAAIEKLASRIVSHMETRW